MSKIKFYCDNKIRDYYKVNEDILPSSMAMKWCMYVTNINRIFNKEHLEEFIYRLAIVLNSKNILDKWLLENKLFDFKFKDICYEFYVLDIEEHLGIEISDGYQDFTCRSLFFKNISHEVPFKSFLYHMNSFKIFDVEEDEDGTIIYDTSELEESFSFKEDEISKKAAFFSSEVLKHINLECFNNENIEMREKEKELKIRREIINNYPKFNFYKIPKDLIYQCLKVTNIYECNKDYIDFLYKDNEDSLDEFKRYIYLAWLFANDMMICDNFYTEEKEGVDIDYNDYDEDGVNLWEFYDENDLKEMESFLKGLFFK